MPAHAEIKKSRSKKQPFKVSYIDNNGEPLASAELLTTKINCKKNIRAMLSLSEAAGESRPLEGMKMLVHDFTDKKHQPFRAFWLHEDGFEKDLS